ncbi:24012_t:CDS:2, partial [Cetraspora pellucida]
MITDQKHSLNSILNELEDTRYIEKIAKLFGLDKQNIEKLEKKLEDYYFKYEKLKKKVNLLKAKTEDLDKCLLCELLNRSDSSLSDFSSSKDSEIVKCYYSKKK